VKACKFQQSRTGKYATIWSRLESRSFQASIHLKLFHIQVWNFSNVFKQIFIFTVQIIKCENFLFKESSNSGLKKMNANCRSHEQFY
jgi:hypothetical protein